MDFSRSEAPLLSPASIQGLCCSLNAPVVRVDDLPVGPARAAIVLHAGDYGGLRLHVGLRSEEGGQVAVFAHRGELAPDVDTTRALEIALSFAEGMGFLFDDDLVAQGGPSASERALRAWQELVGGVQGATSPGAAAPSAPLAEAQDDAAEEPDELGIFDEALEGAVSPADVGGEELLLEDLAQAVPVLEPEPARSAPPAARPSEPAPRAARAVEAEPVAEAPRVRTGSGLPLTKFRSSDRSARRVEDAEGERSLRAATEDGSSSGGSELGKIPIVRRRRGAEVEPRPGFLARLLGSF